MSHSVRKIVIPGDLLGTTDTKKAGKGTYVEHKNIYANILGILNERPPYINIIPIKGRYDAIVGDIVIGIVDEPLSSSWLVNINAPYPALLHVSEVPWDVDFGETEKYLNSGDSIMVKVQQVDLEKKLQITMKDRGLYKIRGGLVIDVEPSKVPRIIGKKGTMINLLKKYTRCRIFVGQNGRIWIDGEGANVASALKAIRMIEDQSVYYGLTDKIEQLLKSERKDV
jgi:exosome complex component RRP4